MSDDSNWLKNPTLPRPPAVPYFDPAELADVPDSDRRFIARTYAREARRQRSARSSGVVIVNRAAQEASAITPARRTA